MQNAAQANVDRLRGLSVRQSMVAVVEPRENGYAEQMMRIIKEERVDLSKYRAFGDARAQIGRFLDAVYINAQGSHPPTGA